MSVLCLRQQRVVGVFSQLNKNTALRRLGSNGLCFQRSIFKRLASSEMNNTTTARDTTVTRSTFNVGAFKSLLNTTHLGREFVYEQQVESTMEIANNILMQANSAPSVHGNAVLSEEQLHGVGRRGRSWKSSALGNIYFSFVWSANAEEPQIQFFEEAKKLNLAISVATVLACEDAVVCGVKWPNDVWTASGKKLSGMIVNVIPQKGCVVGVGINVNETFEAELPIVDDAKTATPVMPSSLAMESGCEVNREEVLAKFCNHLERLMGLTISNVLDEYNAMDLMKGKQVFVFEKSVGEKSEGDYEAEACGILPDGSYQVKRSDGEKVELMVEEVSIRPTV
eukprot:m.38114 g.38114  ORF g.38114 m.38114 type:complete len:339 (+) comp10183_c0_seq2:32-1048(+)